MLSNHKRVVAAQVIDGLHRPRFDLLACHP
jgi:hypothetical protein